MRISDWSSDVCSSDLDARRNHLARMAGRRIVEMVHEDLVLSKILTRQAFENAIRTLAAIGGSTNAVVHLLAIAGRIGVPRTEERRVGKECVSSCRSRWSPFL